MLDFPTSPNDGQTYGGYVFLNGVWVQSGTLVNTGSPFKRTVFTANTTTFQYDSTTLYADVEVLGAGGGGGIPAGASAAGSSGAGAAGAGGGYSKRLIQITDTIRAATKTITIGAGGLNTVAGGNSSYADTVNTLAGNGGAAGANGSISATLVQALGGLGGIASGGALNLTGQPGGNSISFGSVQLGAGAAAAQVGHGAPSILGGGGGQGSVCTATTSVFSIAGASASHYGGGGSGSMLINAAGGVSAGGTGGAGVVIITEYR